MQMHRTLHVGYICFLKIRNVKLPPIMNSRGSLNPPPFLQEDIEVVAQYLAKARNDNRIASGWSLVYADNGKGADRDFVASRLVLGNECIKCRPDGVMHHGETDEILIIERKITSRFEREIPEQSWPNIRAQLWCYAWIDDWASAKKVTLMDEIWRRNITTGEPSPPKVRRFWDRSDKIWQDSEKLFLLFGGRIYSEQSGAENSFS